MMTAILCDERQLEAPNPRKRQRRTAACDHCRVKKIKCNGGQPSCTNCLDRNGKCVYTGSKRRAPKPSLESNEALLSRIARMESMFKEAKMPLGQLCSNDSQDTIAAESLQMMSNSLQSQQQMPLSPPQTHHSYQSHQWTQPETPHMTALSHRRESQISLPGNPFPQSNRSPSAAARCTQEQAFHQQAEAQQLTETHDDRAIDNNTYQSSHDLSVIDPELRSEQNPPEDKSVNSVYSPENSDWEYHGPGSFLSLCSKPGIDWVAERTGSNEFGQIAKSFSRTTTKPLKLDQKISPDRAPEPDRETAFRYTKTYFEKTPDSAFHIVIRSHFEARLRAQFDSGGCSGQDEDPAWYALRNVIYAQGARFELGQGGFPSDFTQAKVTGGQYFENALSKFFELSFCRTGLMAVQALLSMALYAEALSCPSIEHILTSSALRLAQSKGLHRQPGSTWGLSEQDTQNRNRIFWLLYSFEKHIAHRSGRTSAIDDDDISCQLPTSVPVNNSNILEFLTLSAKHAQVSSQIGKRCSTVAAYRQSPDELVKTISELHQKLQEWRDLFPPSIRPGGTFDPSNLPPDFQIAHVLWLHYSYFGSLIGIHSILTYPWSGMLGRDRIPVLRDQVKKSTEIVAETSRHMILMTKHINDIYAWTPTCFGFYYPVLALINLFVHVLKYPTAPSAPSDISLMDVMSGHFARIEFASSGQLSFSIARELSMLGRLAVKRAQQNSAVPSNREPPAANVDSDYVPVYDQMSLEAFDYGLSDSNMVNFDMENWSTLLPSFSPDDMMNFDMDGQEEVDIYLPTD